MGRPLRGSRLASFYTSDTEADPVAPPSLSTLDSAFQLQEYISAVVRLNPHDIERIVKVPGANASANGEEKEKDAAGDDERVSVDEACWIYEQLRRLAQDLTHPLITMLQQECTRQTCPEMKAGEWLYLCVAHGNSGAMEHCCAIDYIVHTLDSATALLNSPRAFPSRISIPQTSHRHFPSLARRLGRIFAHAYHHHRLAFESAEAESALYARFLALSRHFDLVPAEFLVIPERHAQDEEEEEGGRGEQDMDRKNVTLLTRYHDDSTSVPAPTMSSSSSQSPRIGGRARTDTMYLSGGYVSPHNRESPGTSPGRLPSPTHTTPALDVSTEQETANTLNKEATEGAMTQQGTDVGLAQAKTDGAAEQVPNSTVPVRIPGQIFTRDFALEAAPPVAEPPGDTADSAPVDDMPSQPVVADVADTDKEHDDTPSSPSPPEDPPAPPVSEADDAATAAPFESGDSTAAPLHAEPDLAELLVPVLAPHAGEGPEMVPETMPESAAEPSQPLADQGIVAAEPDVPQATSEEDSEVTNDDEIGAAATPEETRGTEVPGDEVIAEVEASNAGVEINEESVDNPENSLQEDGVSEVRLGGT